MTKDIDLIPTGHYCYVPDEEKNKNKKDDDFSFYIKLCPYFSHKKDEGVGVVYCKFLKEGGIINDTTDKDFKKLIKKYGSDENVYKKYPLDLLWDQVKECGENE